MILNLRKKTKEEKAKEKDPQENQLTRIERLKGKDKQPEYQETIKELTEISYDEEVGYNIEYRIYLIKEQARLRDRIEKIKREYPRRYNPPCFVFLTGVIALVVYAVFRNPLEPNYIFEKAVLMVALSFMAGGALGLIYAMFFKSQFIVDNTTLVSFRERLAAVNEDLGLLKIPATEHYKKAEAFFKNHQKELRRYYNENLKHLKWVLPLGVLVIMLGVGIIGFTVVYSLREGAATAEMIIGSVSGIAVDFVGAIFIKIYVETANMSKDFHNQLIKSNNNLLANMLAAQIQDDAKREEVLAGIAEAVACGCANPEK
ncbi:MAG: hypothetical protein LBI36_05595 [Oscillospiraceae bacterium]|jgi:hypothetical protein|nr:hypothetical protein [Oscillospiraceae bacterium]